MPKSKPPRRRYRPLRRIGDFDERMMTFYDTLEAAADKMQQRIAPFLDQIPAKERACVLTQLAAARSDIVKARADIFEPSPTPVLDALLQQEVGRRRDAARQQR
jgi:hypothetical protein